jgi:hypothetical protein
MQNETYDGRVRGEDAHGIRVRIAGIGETVVVAVFLGGTSRWDLRVVKEGE